MAMATTMTMTTGSMALHHAALANPLFCASSALPPLRLAAGTPGAASTAVLRGEPLALRREARGAGFRRFAKFQQFSQDGTDETAVEEGGVEDAEEEDDAEQILPQNLETAMIHAGEAAGLYINSGGTRVIAELLVPELENLNEDGAQQRVWDLSRLFLDTLQETLGNQRVKAIFPDAGVAAFVKYQWKDVPYVFGSLNDRRPVSNEDEVVVLLTPDHQGLPDVERINTTLAGDDDTPARPMVMLNPRLVSGDVGIGLNVRRMRERLLSKFTTVYSVRPLQDATIFRQYPGLWQIFVDDRNQPGRLILAKEQPSRPTLDDIDMLLLGGENSETGEQPSALANAVGVFASFNRFMRSLSQ
ncbi:hypothetical protein M758_2G113400 [Ceratodon purpureus]|nr:hypothetical protein M758_2G113400 [Ceratodon purpureus]